MDLLVHTGYALVYAVVGIAVLGLGYAALDLVTPGHLGSHIWTERSVNAAIVLAAGLLGLGFVVFGVLGVLLQALAFRLLDLVTPGDMAELVTQREFHPASVVAAAVQLAVSLIVVASIA